MIFIGKISKGHNSVKMKMELRVIFSAHRLMMIYILYKVSLKYSRRYLSYRADKIFIGKISKGGNSVKNVGGVTVLFLCTLSDGGFIFV